MNFAQMLMTGPKLVSQERKPHPNKYDDSFVKEVLLQCLPGTTKEICAKSGYSPRTTVRYLKEIVEQGIVRKRSSKTSAFGNTRIYEKVRSK